MINYSWIKQLKKKNHLCILLQILHLSSVLYTSSSQFPVYLLSISFHFTDTLSQRYDTPWPFMLRLGAVSNVRGVFKCVGC